MPRPPEWRAGRDQIAHAVDRGALRARCGIRPTDPRLAWPAVAKCPDCLVATGVKGVEGAV